MSDVTRRSFLRASAGFVTAASLASAARLGAAHQSSPLGVAVIGPGGMGSSHLRLLAARKDVRVAYVCDVDANRLAAAAKVVEQNGGSPKAAFAFGKASLTSSLCVTIAPTAAWNRDRLQLPETYPLTAPQANECAVPGGPIPVYEVLAYRPESQSPWPAPNACSR